MNIYENIKKIKEIFKRKNVRRCIMENVGLTRGVLEIYDYRDDYPVIYENLKILIKIF